MTKLGADADALDRLASAFAGLADRLVGVDRELAAALTDAAWRGADADGFRSRWQRYGRSTMARAAGALRTAGVDARRQAADQRRVSAADVAVVPTGPRLAPAADRVRLVTLTVGAGEGLGVAASSQWRVDDLGHGRVRVTELEQATFGAVPGAGVQVGASRGDGREERSLGTGAAVSVTAGLTLGGERSWVVPEGDIERLLLSQGVERATGTPSPLTAAVASAVPFGGALASAVGLGGLWDGLTYGAAPERVGVRAGLAGEAAVEAGSTGNVVSAASSGVAGISVDTRTGELSVRLESDALVAAASLLGVPTVGHDVAATLALDRSGAPVRLEVETSRPTPVAGHEGVERVRAAVDLTDPDVAVAARRLLAALATDGDVSGAATRLVGVGAAHAAVSVDRYRIAGTDRVNVSTPVVSGSLSYTDLRRVR
ncbi:MAG: hypothetical protein U0Q22_18160 [Acidimicrobiales bacterium]